MASSAVLTFVGGVAGQALLFEQVLEAPNQNSFPILSVRIFCLLVYGRSNSAGRHGKKSFRHGITCCPLLEKGPDEPMCTCNKILFKE